MISDRLPCKTPDCDNTVSASIGLEFCFSCSSRLHREFDELCDDLSKVLRLEAEFVQWCVEHGQPNPHE